MREVFKQRQIAAAATALLILLLLFVKAQPVDPDSHNRVSGDIAELQKRDTELGETVLQLHYHLTNNYDGVVALMQHIDALGAALQRHQQQGLLPDTPEARHAMTVLRARIEEKAALLNDFKSGNAVMKNSLIYLPSLIGQVLEKLPHRNEVASERFEQLLRDALLVSINADEGSIDMLEADIVEVESILPTLPENIRGPARYVVLHARLLLEMDRTMPALLTELTAFHGYTLGADLDALYQDYYQRQQQQAAIYRFFLLLAAMLTLGYSIFVYIRLKQQSLQLEHALAQIGNQQQALNEHAIVSITDMQGNITYVNDRFIRISGYSSDELIGRNHRMIQSGYHSREFFQDMWRTIANGRVWHGQVKNRARNGSYYWVEATMVPFMDKSGKPYQYVSMRTDITAQKNMEQQLLAERRLLQNVMDTLGEGVFMLDVDGNCTYLNREAEAIIGWTSEELQGRNLHEIIHAQQIDGTELPASACPIRQATMADKVYRSESDYFQHKNGTLFPIAIVAQPLKDEDEIVGIVAAFQDISERKFFERELLRAKDDAEAASRAKGHFLATMSHEIRTPMNGIIGMTELALDTDLNPVQREYLNMVKSSADSLLTIINDILDFSKIESGKMELEHIEFDVASLFSITEKSLALRAEQRGIELVYEVDERIPDYLVGDPGRLRQVLINLLGNAIKFSDRGVVAMRMQLLKISGNAVTVRIEVADQGIGISIEQQMHIFDAFTQADASTTRKYGGTGLGLAISSQLVAAMGGELTVTSELGKGSVFGFSVTLPTGKNAQSAPQDMAGLSALIVDDNPTNRRQLSQMLTKWGMAVGAVATASDARQSLLQARSEAKSYDLLLLDAEMPEMDGFTLVQQLQSMQLPLRAVVMMLSSDGLRTETERCRKLGLASHVCKPIDRGELLSVIRKALGLKEPVMTAVRSGLQTPQQQLTILLAEDNRVNQRLAITLLEKWGHRVVLANNGLEALDKYREQVFDVILMDLQMPEMGGIEATQQIRALDLQNGRHTPIIAMTANAMSEDRQLCLDAGMDEYLSKPLSSEKMRSLLQQVTPASRQAEQHQAFDYAAALNQIDAWVIETIGQAFLDESDVLLDEMRSAIEAQDQVLLVRSAHTLRGLAGNFNAKGVEDLTRKIEKHAEQVAVADIEQLFGRLQSEMSKLKSALADYLATMKPA